MAAPGIRIELVRAGDAPPRAAWRALAAGASTRNIFHEAWIVEAAAMLPEAGPYRLLLAWRGDALIGLLPIAMRRALGGRIAIAAENWDQRIRALGDPLIRAGEERAFWRAVLAFLDRRRDAGRYLRLTALDAESASTRALLAERAAYVTRSHERAVLNAGPGAAEYVAANIRGKVLKEHRRLRNRLAEQGALVFDRLGAEEAAGPWIDALFALEMTGWKGRDGVAAAADPGTEAAFRAMLAEAHAQRRLDFHRMSVGGRVLALLANVEAGDTAYQIKIAYDEAYAAFSPGVLLEMRYLEHALDERGLAHVDSCARAGHPMIDRIWIDRKRVVSLAVPYRGWPSRAICAGQDWVRRRRAVRGAGGEGGGH